MPPQVALAPETLQALQALRRAVQGPYLIRITGAVRRGDVLVEAEVSYWRTEDGEEGLSVAPIPYGRTWQPGPPARGDGPPAPAQRVYAAQTYDEYQASGVTATLAARDDKGATRNLVAVGGADQDDVVDEVGAPKPKRRSPVRKKTARKKTTVPKKRKTRRLKAGTKAARRGTSAKSGLKI